MQIGDYRLEIVPDTEFWLDGGAMYGVVPRALWERVTPPDQRNRIRLTTNCVFIDTGKEKVLIDTGIGEKWSEKEIEIYGIKRERPFAESLKSVTGCTPEDITIVVNTHLHFDHSGGNTTKGSPPYEGGVDAASADGVVLSSVIPQFPNARYLVSRSEFEEAENPHERERASYLKENWQPVKDAGQLELMPDEFEAVPGLTFQTERGHSPTMQTWRLETGGETVYGFADLIPTRHHLPLPWIMGYDLEPAHTLEFKKRILPLAARSNWLCHFYHDPEIPLARLREHNGRFVSEPGTK
jgi:glyoxylase-like metal-dependent hydrolase (beta-lactamase superfamily II)